VSSHSFTPVLDGEVRRADIGLLYDPRRSSEVDFCRAWQSELRSGAPPLAVRRNFPYRGYDDGLTTYLRRHYPDGVYCGVELEVNQKHALGDAAAWRGLRKRLTASLHAALESGTRRPRRRRADRRI